MMGLTRVNPPDERPLLSSLPMEDAEFRSISEQFLELASEQLATLRTALEAEDLAEIRRVLHWLKGAGGTGGYMPISAAAVDAQERIARGDLQGLAASAAELASLVQRAVHGLAVRSD